MPKLIPLRLSRRLPPFSLKLQASLILLPVLALTVMGFIISYRDFAATEREARQRAHEILSSLAPQAANAVHQHLSHLDRLGADWLASNASNLLSLSNSQIFNPIKSPASPGERLSRQLDSLRQTHPAFHFRPEDIFPVHVEISPERQLLWPRPYGPPTPAPWTIAQPNLIESDEDASGPASIPLPDEFIAWQHLLSNHLANPQLSDPAAFVQFAQNCGEASAASGLPLAAVALYQAFQSASAADLPRGALAELARQCHHLPSFLIAPLLDQALTNAASQNQTLQLPLLELQSHWRAQERLRSLAQAILPNLSGLDAASPSPLALWFNTPAHRWLALLESPNPPATSLSNQPPPNAAIPSRRIVFFPKQAVRQAVELALQPRQTLFPAYLTAEVFLASEPIFEPAAQTPGAPAPFASASARSLANHKPAEPSLQPNPAQTAAAQPISTAFELTMTLRLTDAPMLFAQARRRMIGLASFVAASFITALAGLTVVHHAFRHQVRLNEMKSNFVSSVSHELRAPMASIRLLVDNLDRGRVTLESKRRDYYHLINKECLRLSSLIENVLDFSRIDRGQKHYEFSPSDLAALIQQTVALMQPYAEEHKVKLIPELPPDPPHPAIDGKAIQQALVNLIDNAIKHSPPNGSVSISLARQTSATSIPQNKSPRRPHPPAHQPFLSISVSDQGPGIPAADHQRIFEQFYRRGSELRRETPGVGIGLSIVKHIAEAHGGRIRVESEPGRGSRFILELPVPTA